MKSDSREAIFMPRLGRALTRVEEYHWVNRQIILCFGLVMFIHETGAPSSSTFAQMFSWSSPLWWGLICILVSATHFVAERGGPQYTRLAIGVTALWGALVIAGIHSSVGINTGITSYFILTWRWSLRAWKATAKLDGLV